MEKTVEPLAGLPAGVDSFRSLLEEPGVAAALLQAGAVQVAGLGGVVHPRVHAASAGAASMKDFLRALDPSLLRRRCTVHAFVSRGGWRRRARRPRPEVSAAAG
jgi:hypothetical protein